MDTILSNSIFFSETSEGFSAPDDDSAEMQLKVFQFSNAFLVKLKEESYSVYVTNSLYIDVYQSCSYLR